MRDHNKAILLVEDNSNDEELTRLALEKNNIDNPLVVVHNGVEALEYIFGSGSYQDRNIYDQPRVVILDLKLPKLDGLQVLKEIRADKRTACIPVVILTSSKEEADLMKAYNLGTNAYIQKPVDFVHFTEAIKQLGQFWLYFNEIPNYCHCSPGEMA